MALRFNPDKMAINQQGNWTKYSKGCWHLNCHVSFNSTVFLLLLTNLAYPWKKWCACCLHSYCLKNAFASVCLYRNKHIKPEMSLQNALLVNTLLQHSFSKLMTSVFQNCNSFNCSFRKNSHQTKELTINNICTQYLHYSAIFPY